MSAEQLKALTSNNFHLIKHSPAPRLQTMPRISQAHVVWIEQTCGADIMADNLDETKLRENIAG